MALAGILAGAAQGNALIQRAAIAYLCRFADDDAGAMINKNIVPDDGAGVDLDTGKKPGELADKTRQEKAVVPVQPVRRSVPKQRVYAGVHQQYFKAGTGSGVALTHRRYVLPDPFAHKKTSHVEDEAFTL